MNPIFLIAIVGGVLYLVSQEEDSPDEEPQTEKAKDFTESLKKMNDPDKTLSLPQEEVTRLRRELRQAIARKKHSTDKAVKS